MSEVADPLLYHFTHIDHLASIVQSGLRSDTNAQQQGLITHEAGNHGIKAQRRAMPVPIPPGGVVSDYVPFYFAPRSPMLFVISKGSVPTYTRPQNELVYVCSRPSRLIELGTQPIFTRRNASLVNAEFFTDPAELATKIDWELMNATMWTNTSEDGDRKARRAAECLVHDRVPPEAIVGIATQSDERMSDVQAILANLGVPLQVVSQPAWYY